MNELAQSMAQERERWIMVRASDDHVIGEYDSIDEPCLTHRGVVMAPELACNVVGSVGRKARDFNAIGRRVWTGQLMLVRGGKIVRRGGAQ